jgi:predicted Rossmann-fold nucleotide-binding protein
LKLVELGDAYVVLKGGTGTLLELACVWEFVNKGIVPKKPIIILGSFWQPVVETLRGELLWEGHGDCTEFIQNAGTAEECAQLLVKAMAQSLVMPAGLS